MIGRKWGYRYKEPPPTLQVLFRDQPIAELEEKPRGYVFRYLPAFAEMKLSPFPGLPKREGDIYFFELPTYFEERLPDTKRPEIREWILQNQVSIQSKLQLLAQLGSHTITDPFEFRLKAA
jgi:hypothetical protein